MTPPNDPLRREIIDLLRNKRDKITGELVLGREATDSLLGWMDKMITLLSGYEEMGRVVKKMSDAEAKKERPQ
jgi:hypothetical protein